MKKENVLDSNNENWYEKSIDIPLKMYESLVRVDSVCLALVRYLEYCVSSKKEVDFKVIDLLESTLL